MLSVNLNVQLNVTDPTLYLLVITMSPFLRILGSMQGKAMFLTSLLRCEYWILDCSLTTLLASRRTQVYWMASLVTEQQ